MASNESRLAFKHGGSGTDLLRSAEVFIAALGLGFTSFGGPLAHLGYFERAYVQARRWLSAEDFAGIVAVCQTLPGPTSSQVGFLIGLKRAGWLGAVAAWLGFTLPSAIIMFAFALWAPGRHANADLAALHGLKLVAVPIVGQAVWSMAKSLCPDWPRAGLACVAALALLLNGSAFLPPIVLVGGAVAGMGLGQGVQGQLTPAAIATSRQSASIAIFCFAGVFLGVAGLAQAFPRSLAGMAARFYGSGSLVFGGGHVVLPFLQKAFVQDGSVSDAVFLSGYGAAQALPGPLFAFSAYVGAVMAPPGSSLITAAVWALTAIVAIFFPGLCLAVAGSRLWIWLGRHPLAPAAMAGVNACVVGILAAAFCSPVWSSGISNLWDLGLAVAVFVGLDRRVAPPVVFVVLCVMSSILLEVLRWT